jgi:hypothetical protein
MTIPEFTAESSLDKANKHWFATVLTAERAVVPQQQMAAPGRSPAGVIGGLEPGHRWCLCPCCLCSFNGIYIECTCC